ncbi:eCIS core domain-containing protein [Roseateles amylovorans]|uniref:DUF4157 domain-containing protein n=1 Tax=Roseateles amylovorans TaxID=2978473 RepID=A0ABY6B5E4_9BURK|nr:DUF4157 domain-containing protein [Roseateles amylovorans]UXH79175.1 DUF4157 domain-containing protein [Roseateles amylovorans]
MAVAHAAALRASAQAKAQQSAARAANVRRPPVSPAQSAASAASRGSSLLLPSTLQTAMQVSSPADPAEREAVSVASQIVRMAPPQAAGIRRSASVSPASSGATAARAPAVAVGIARSASTLLSLSPSMVHRAGRDGGGAVSAPVAAEIRASAGGGQALPAPVRAYMEPRFRADFSPVRLHTDARSAALAAQLGARAFTVGRDIHFARDAYQPDSPSGRELIAHELTHTIQQRAAPQVGPVHREAATEVGPAVSTSEPVQVHRLGWDTALNFFADKANLLPGFRMLTIVLGRNPINNTAVEASPGNVFRAIVEFIPGATVVTEAISNAGIFDKVANWAYGQLKSVMAALGSLGSAVLGYVKSLGASDLLSPGAAIDRGIHLVTDPINQIKSVVAGFIGAILDFIKEAILRPLGKLAEGTPSYDLLKGVMGEDPVTGEPVTDSADLMVGGFMKIIGQEEIYANIKKSGALGQCWTWFQSAMGELKGFVAEIPALFIAGLKSLELADIVLVPRAFAKLAKVFGNFLGRFVTWAGQAMWNLLEIIFKVVNPGALEYVKKTGAALKSILQNPMPFLGNLIAAGKGGFSAFSGNFLSHLKKGLIDWLTGSLDGVYIPKALTLGEVVKFVFSVLGLTWQRFRVKIVKAFGETTAVAMEKGFDIVMTLVNEGPAAAWEKIKSELEGLKDQVIEGIKGLVIEAVVTKGIPKLVAMFIPGAGFIGAIVSIYDTVMVVVNQVSKIIAVVKSFVDSIVNIANGNIGSAIEKVESVLASGLSLAINFFAAFAGLGKVAQKINGVIQKIRAPVDKAMDSLIGWIKKMAKSFIDKLAGKDAPPEEKQKRVEKAAAAGLKAVTKFSGKVVGDAVLKPILLGIKLIHRVTTLVPVKEGDYWSIRAEINPVKTVKTSVKAGKNTAEMEVGYEPDWPLDEFRSKANAIKRAAEGKTANQAATLGFVAGSTTQRQSTKPLRQGGQDAFRSEIHAYIDQIKVKADQNAARTLMGQLQADHQQELQMGGTDTAANMAMIESRMNSQMGAMWRGQLKDLEANTKITKVKIETKTGTAKGQNHRASGAAATLQALLLKHAAALGTKPTVIRRWFKL